MMKDSTENSTTLEASDEMNTNGGESSTVAVEEKMETSIEKQIKEVEPAVPAAGGVELPAVDTHTKDEEDKTQVIAATTDSTTSVGDIGDKRTVEKTNVDIQEDKQDPPQETTGSKQEDAAQEIGKCGKEEKSAAKASVKQPDEQISDARNKGEKGEEKQRSPHDRDRRPSSDRDHRSSSRRSRGRERSPDRKRRRLSQSPTAVRMKDIPPRFFHCTLCKVTPGSYEELVRHFSSAIHRTQDYRETHTVFSLRCKELRNLSSMMQRDLELMFPDRCGEKMMYCNLCLIKFKEISGYDHETSHLHKELVKILHPYCEICDKRLDSRRVDAHHSSANHIEKAYVQNQFLTIDEIGITDIPTELPMEEVENPQVEHEDEILVYNPEPDEEGYQKEPVQYIKVVRYICQDCHEVFKTEIDLKAHTCETKIPARKVPNCEFIVEYDSKRSSSDHNGGHASQGEHEQQHHRYRDFEHASYTHGHHYHEDRFFSYDRYHEHKSHHVDYPPRSERY